MTELEAEVKRISERMEKYHSELLEKIEWMNVKINQITDAFGTLQGYSHGTQSQVKPTKQQVRNVKLDFQNIIDWIFKVFDYYATSDVDN